MNLLPTKIKTLIAHPLARGSAIVFAGTMLINVGAYLYHLIVGRMLGPEKYGELASLFSLSYILNVPAIVVATVIAKYISQYTAGNQDGKAKNLIIRSTVLLARISLVATIVAIPFFGYIVHFLHVTSVWYVAYMVFASAVFFPAIIASSALQGYQKFSEVMVYGNIGIFIRLAGGVIGAGFGVGATAFAHFITTVLAYVISLAPLKFLLPIRAQKTGLSIRVISAYAVPSMLCILGITSLYSTDVILVKHFFSAFDAGIYAALAMMGKVIFFAGSSVGYVLFPVVAKRSANGGQSRSLIYVSLGIVLLISLGITLGYVLFPNLALQLLFGASYLAAAKYLGLFGVFITFFSLSNVISTALLGLGRTAGWIYLLGAAVIQIIGIILFHGSITQVIYVNITVCAALTAVLLLYYRHGRV